MSDIEAARGLLADAFGRIQEGVVALTDGLSDEVAWYRPDPRANSIAWTLWHLARVVDDHVSDAAGSAPVWPGWRDRFGLPFEDDATGYGQTAEQVGQVRVPADLLAGYYGDVHRAVTRYLDQVTAAELARVVDTRWDPPVTVAVRLVSVVDDATRHLGQAEYVRGLAERRDGAWHSPAAADR